MDTATIITSLISSGAVSLGAARWLTTHLIDHRLAKDLADHKAALDQRLAASKSELDRRVAAANAQLETTLRKGVEEYETKFVKNSQPKAIRLRLLLLQGSGVLTRHAARGNSNFG